MEQCLDETFDGIGPDRLTIEPAQRQRFAVQFHRVATDGGYVLEAAIPATKPERRILLAHGWAAPDDRGGGHYHRTFSTAAEAAVGVVDALSAVYGTVGDEKGWYVLATVQHGDSAWVGGRWSGDESEVEGLAAAPTVFDPSRPVAALFGLAVGLVCAWAVLQSFVAYSGWVLGPVPTIAIVLGSSLWAMIVSLSPLPVAVEGRTAYLVGGGVFIWALIAGGFSSIPAIAWSIALVQLFGTPPAT
jgi:hypothetical protein